MVSGLGRMRLEYRRGNKPARAKDNWLLDRRQCCWNADRIFTSGWGRRVSEDDSEHRLVSYAQDFGFAATLKLRLALHA